MLEVDATEALKDQKIVAVDTAAEFRHYDNIQESQEGPTNVDELCKPTLCDDANIFFSTCK